MRKLVFLLSLFFSGCYYHQTITPEISGNSSYLPLEIGNSWDFQPLTNPPGALIHCEVTGLASINSHQYYLLVTSSTYSDRTYKDSAYYRIDNNGFVYIYDKNQPNLEANRFRLNAQNGDTWTYPVDNNSVATIKTTVGPLVVGSTEIAKCKSYYFDVVNWADEEYTITLAPGIGFVKEYSNAWGMGQILKSAKIHGQVYNF